MVMDGRQALHCSIGGSRGDEHDRAIGMVVVGASGAARGERLRALVGKSKRLTHVG